MARKHSWSGSLDQILNDLDHFEGQYLTRSGVQALFNVGRSRADRLMELAGKETNNGEVVVAKRALLLWLERAPEAAAARREQERRKALAKKLEADRVNLSYRAVPIQTKPEDEWATFKDLPEITLQPGLMEIRCHSKPELLSILWRLSKALVNDWPTFEKLCGEKGPPKDDALKRLRDELAKLLPESWVC